MISSRKLGRQRLRNLNPRPRLGALKGGVRYSELESSGAGLNSLAGVQG